MSSFVGTQASLLVTHCGSSSLGPSGALSYAVGFVAGNLQLQKKNRGFHWKPHLLINRTLPPHVARLQGASRLVATCPCLMGAK